MIAAYALPPGGGRVLRQKRKEEHTMNADTLFNLFKAMPRDAQARMVDAMKADARERWTQADIAAFPADIRAKLVKHGVLPA